jgi:hypothetical protein
MANARRSLGDALAMTPDKLAFIQGANAAQEAKPTQTVELPKPISATEEPVALTEVIEAERTEVQSERPAARSPRRQSRERDQSEFNDEAMLSMANLLVPLTTRLQPRTAAALKRAGLEQKLRGRKPSTVQEIAEEAIQLWLRNSGYLA